MPGQDGLQGLKTANSYFGRLLTNNVRDIRMTAMFLCLVYLIIDQGLRIIKVSSEEAAENIPKYLPLELLWGSVFVFVSSLVLIRSLCSARKTGERQPLVAEGQEPEELKRLKQNTNYTQAIRHTVTGIGSLVIGNLLYVAFWLSDDSEVAQKIFELISPSLIALAAAAVVQVQDVKSLTTQRERLFEKIRQNDSPLVAGQSDAGFSPLALE